MEPRQIKMYYDSSLRTCVDLWFSTVPHGVSSAPPQIWIHALACHGLAIALKI